MKVKETTAAIAANTFHATLESADSRAKLSNAIITQHKPFAAPSSLFVIEFKAHGMQNSNQPLQRFGFRGRVDIYNKARMA